MDFNEIKGLRGHPNACLITKTKLTFAEHSTASGLCALCTKDQNCEVGLKAKTGRTVFPGPFGVAQFAAEKRLPGMSDIQIIPELFGEGQVFKTLSSETTLGGLKVNAPLSIAGMGSTKVASDNGKQLAEGAALAGITCVIGENVIATFGPDGVKARIKPFLDNYQKKGGIIVQGNVEDQKQQIFQKAIEFGCHGIELKLGQGAKQGLGGEIQFKDPEEAEKYKALGYTVIQKLDGTFERHSFPGTLSKEGLREKLIELNNYGIPVWIKIAVGTGIFDFLNHVNDLKKNDNLKNVKAVTVDGFGGGTGMSPWLIMNETCLPSAVILKKKPKLNYDLLLAGGYVNGMDVAKAMMLGAKGVAMGRAMLIAANNPDKTGQGIKNFVEATSEELKMVCATQRVNHPDKLIGRRKNLLALNAEAAELFGLPTDPLAQL